LATVAQPSSTKTFEEEQQQQTQQITNNRLVERLLGSGANLPAFMAELARTQAAVVAGTEAAAFVIEPAPGQQGPQLKLVQHIRNDSASQDVRQRAQEAFRQLVGRFVQEGRDGAVVVGEAKNENDPEGPQFALITLLRNESAVVAASCVICRCRNDELASQRLQAMQLVAGYFDLYTLRRSHDQSKAVAKSHQDVLQLATAFGTGEGFKTAAANLCNELATRTGASRVALGWLKGVLRGDDIVVQAISHTEEFDKKQELTVQLVKVMEEAYDQNEVVQFDPAGGSTDNVCREAQKLSQMEGGNRVFSLPLRQEDDVKGVLTLEFPSEKPATQQEATMLAVAADLLAPQLKDRYDNDRYLPTKALLSGRELAAKTVGPKHMLGKLIAIALLTLLVLLILPLGTYKIPAPFVVEPPPEATRVVSAPLEGVIKSVMVRSGDTVAAGDEMLAFDVTDLQNQLLQAERSAASKMIEARNEFDQGNSGRGLQLETQAEADAYQAAFLRSQINRATLQAPIDGLVLEGDFQERIDDVVQKGQQMFRLADPAAGKIAVLRVDERDIQRFDVGAEGHLATKAEPGTYYPFKVTKISPITAAAEGSSRYEVTAELMPILDDDGQVLHDPNDLPYNQEGQAKITQEGGRVSYGYIWTHRLWDYLRVKLWL
jgi:multidrug resistance efflux pump